jgi:hypothetical protein
MYTDGGTEALFAEQSNGRVGLGTTAPNHTLDVNGNIGLATSSYINFGSTDGTTGYGFRDNAGTIQYKNSGGDWANMGGASNLQTAYEGGETIQLTAAQGDLRMYNDSNNEMLFLDESSGKVGIGYTAPAAYLQVLGTTEQLRLAYDASNYTSFTIDASGILTIADTGTTVATFGAAGASFAVPTTFDAAGDVSFAYDLQFTSQDSAYIKSNAPLYLVAGESFENNNLTLRTYGTGSVVADLSGTGNMRLVGTDTSLIFDTKTATDTDFWMGIQDNAGGNDDDKLMWGDGTTAGSNIFMTLNTSGNLGIGTTGPLNKLDILGNMALGTYAGVNTAPTNGLIVSGSIGIGLTDPGTYELNVSGQLNTTDLYIGGTQVTSTAVELNRLDGTTVTSGGIIFGNGTYLTNDVSSLFWDNTNNILSIGSSAPSGGGFFSVEASAGVLATGFYAGSSEYGMTADSGAGYLALIAGGTQTLFVDGDSQVGIGTTAPAYQLELSTDSAGKPTSNTWTVVSDERLKKDITPFNDGLDVIRQINPINYKLNGLGRTPADAAGIGVIAQQIKEVAPYTIKSFWAKLHPEDAEKTELYSFDSSALTFVTINAIKELDEQTTTDISSLKDEVSLIKELMGLGSAAQSTESTSSVDTSLLADFKKTFEEFKSFVAALGISATTDNGLLVSSDMNVLGSTTLGDLTVTGDITAGQMKFDTLNNIFEINGPACYNTTTLTKNDTLCDAQTLYLMKNLAGNIDAFDGNIVLEPDGNITVKGTVAAAKVKAGEFQVTNSSQTVGSGTISSGTTSIEIESSAVKANSKIFVTATSSTGGQSLIVKEKVEGTSFMVSVDSTTVADITFDWWILNVE